MDPTPLIEKPDHPLQVALIGGRRHNTTEQQLAVARSFGVALARRGHILISGADDGTASEAGLGAREASGLVVGIMKADSERLPFCSISIGTRMDVSRGALLIYSADVVCAFPGSFGTIAELGVALDVGRPVILVNWWPFSEHVRHSTWAHRISVSSAVDIDELVALIEKLGSTPDALRSEPPREHSLDARKDS